MENKERQHIVYHPNGGYYGIYDPFKRKEMPTLYKYVTPVMEEDETIVVLETAATRKVGLYDLAKGKKLIPCQYEAIEYYGRDYAVVMSEDTGKYGAYSIKEGREILPCQFDIIKIKNGAAFAVRMSPELTFNVTEWEIYDLNKNKRIGKEVYGTLEEAYKAYLLSEKSKLLDREKARGR